MSECQTEGGFLDYSEDFYRSHGRRYSEVSHLRVRSTYINTSHPAFKGDMDLQARLVELAPGRKGLDAGCGPGARDVHHLWSMGFDIWGIDAVQGNILEAQRRHPEIADRVSVADLRQALPFPDTFFDFVMCNAVIQHIDPESLKATTLPELSRVLKPGGVLQLMFKNGSGVISVYDRVFGVDRAFLLYEETKILEILKEHGCDLIETGGCGELGGLIYFTDYKPVDHCVFYVRKSKALSTG